MADGLVSPPSNDLGLSAGNSGGGTANPKAKRNLIIGGVAAVGLVVVYLFAKSKSSSTAASSGTSTSPADVIEPASNTDTTVASIGSSLSQQQEALLAQEQANGSSLTNSLSNILSQIEASIAGSQGSIISAIGSSGSVAAATPAPAAGATPTAAPSLPAINASAWPNIIKFGQDANAATDFTPIGDVVGGVFNGTGGIKGVSGGAPVYAGLYGGYAQGFNEATLPNDTELYIPTALAQYEVK